MNNAQIVYVCNNQRRIKLAFEYFYRMHKSRIIDSYQYNDALLEKCGRYGSIYRGSISYYRFSTHYADYYFCDIQYPITFQYIKSRVDEIILDNNLSVSDVMPYVDVSKANVTFIKRSKFDGKDKNKMELDVFVKQMKSKIDLSILKPKNRKKLIQKSLEICKDNKIGHYNQIIVMEELAELSKEVSKFVRLKGNRDALLEEMADVLIGIDYLKEIHNISDKELDKAIAIKLYRLKHAQSKGEYK